MGSTTNKALRWPTPTVGVKPNVAQDLRYLAEDVDAAIGIIGVFPEDHRADSDGTDWGPAIGRALAYATPLGLPVRLQRTYPVASTINLNTGDTLIGAGPSTGLIAPVNTSIALLKGTGIASVTLQNLTVDGNSQTTTTKLSARSVQFVNSTKLRVHHLTTQYNPDWGCSFESCTDVLVTDYVHRNGTTGNTTAFAGRDGIHFLDCSDTVLDGAKIHSRDDCVGITSKTSDISRITIRNVTGISETAAIVTLGNETGSAFTANDIAVENIEAYSTASYPGGVSPYLVKLRAQNGSVAQKIRVANVTGKASSHAVWLEGTSTTPDSMTDVVITGIHARSSGGHGVYLHYVTHFEAHAVWGQSQAGAFDGVNLTNCGLGAVLGGSARQCSLWGLQLNTCTSVDVIGFTARDNGATSFASNTGGNGRIISCIDIQVVAGQYVGADTVSYYGLNTTGNTAVVVSAMTRTGGAH